MVLHPQASLWPCCKRSSGLRSRDLPSTVGVQCLVCSSGGAGFPSFFFSSRVCSSLGETRSCLSLAESRIQSKVCGFISELGFVSEFVGSFMSFVLNDGGNEELQSFCDDLKVRDPRRVVYIRREKVKGMLHNFKCGNINNGLKYSEAEYVVMMDADMILHLSYLRRLLPHIVNSA